MQYGYYAPARPEKSMRLLCGVIAAVTAAVLLLAMPGIFGFLKDIMGIGFSQGKTGGQTTVPQAIAQETGSSGVRQIVTNKYLDEYHYGLEMNEGEEGYWENFVAAALYEDGTVTVSCRSEYRQNYDCVRDWKNIEKLWLDGTALWALDGSGQLYSNDPARTSLPGKVADLVCSPDGTFAILTDGNVVGLTQAGAEAASGWKNVKQLHPVSDTYPWGFTLLRQDGTTATVSGQAEGSKLGPTEHRNVRSIQPDVFNGTCTFYKNDGSVVCFGDADPQGDKNLFGSVNVVPMVETLAFGVTEKGELKVSCGLEEYHRTYAVSDESMYAPLEEAKCTGVKYLLSSEGRGGMPVMLYEDGTLYSPCKPLNDVISTWTGVKKIGWYEGYTWVRLYALLEDGSVMTAEGDFGFYGSTVTENYLNWELEDLYVGRYAGAIGVCRDGTFVGDMAFQYLDLNTLGRNG